MNILLPASIMLLSLFVKVRAQNNILLLPEVSGEKIMLFTDRNMYAVSENILFSAEYITSVDIATIDWSKVLYAELVDWKGESIARSKVQILEGHAHGAIPVPADLRSGNYYLRAYTKWMRNYSPYEYAYQSIKIINPYSRYIDDGPGSKQLPIEREEQFDSNPGKVFQMNGLKNTYRRGENVELELILSEKEFEGRYSVSVCPKGSQRMSSHSVNFVPPITPVKQEGIEFLPEVSGLSLSGRVIEKSGGLPAGGVDLHLSSYSSSFYYSVSKSREDGFFVFTLPHYNGQHEFHIALEEEYAQDYDLLLSSEFCSKKVELPYIPFSLSAGERKLATDLAFNAQVASRFADMDRSNDRTGDSKVPFYGQAPTVIYEKDFIELTDLREFFYELVHNVAIAYRNKEAYLKVQGTSSLVSYPSLILMDNIPVENGSELLNIPCRMIERIEVISSGYIVGQNKYNGIVSIYSENRDMAGLVMGENSHFFSFSLFDTPGISNKLCYTGASQESLPARRNQLCWDPDLQLLKDLPVNIDFSCPDLPGEYLISIRGFNKNSSKLVEEHFEFSVK